MKMIIPILAIIGFFVSLYAYYIEKKIAKDPTYKPMCDLSDRISCSKPIVSPWGKIIIFSNALIGMIFYVVVLLFYFLNYTPLLFYSALIAVGASLVLAYILFFKIKTLCLLCCCIYVINILLLFASYKIYK